MSTNDQPGGMRIGVFAARDGWRLVHPRMQSRFADRDEAIAEARRLAHLEAWRGREVDVLIQDGMLDPITVRWRI